MIEMFTQINWIATIVAALVGFGLGGLWYGPLFGKTWMALSKFTPEDMAAAKARGMAKAYAITFVGTLVTAFVLGNLVVSLEKQTFADGFGLGFLLWLGLVAPVLLGSVLWEWKSGKLWALNSGFHLVALVVMGMILSVWR